MDYAILSSSEVHFLTKSGHFPFLSPLWYTVHLRLTVKHVVDFLLLTTKHFLLGGTAEALQANTD